MKTDTIDTLKEIIHLAILHERESGDLRNFLSNELPFLHTAIRLSSDQPVESLLALVTAYIESVPQCIEAIDSITRSARISDYTDTLLKIATDYFIHPPAALEGQAGLYILMSEAYLAHRLMEEINDRFIGHCGIPLIPTDMTRSNIIVHQLIGEPFANELDLAVQYSLEICTPKEAVFDNIEFNSYIDEHKERGWKEELKNWPCLEESYAISLKFDETNYSNVSDFPASKRAFH